MWIKCVHTCKESKQGLVDSAHYMLATITIISDILLEELELGET